MHIYYHDNAEGDQRADHYSGTDLSDADVAKLGVSAFFFDGPTAISDIDKLAIERNYKNKDEICISPATFGADVYEEKVKIFYKEHLHEDEEIRYIVDGEGFFDVRDLQDRWVRLKLVKGDLIILPAGIYHRFTTTSTNYVKAMRLFKDEPKWTPLARPCDDNEYRMQYLQSVAAN
ncbi:Acireductone dioxygenase ARD family [Kockiozyma suomiensis]|uniref:Acireductone dioxygenase ARD family n=1 Tax=Kockiozyma suomiensis TaxID=1337062 RepID=UPI0033437C5F